QRRPANLREIPQLVKRLDDIDCYDDLEVLQEQWLELLNSFEDLQEALESVCDLITGDIVGLDTVIAILKDLHDSFQIGSEDYFKRKSEVLYLIEFLEFCNVKFTSLGFDLTDKKFTFD
ncbi:TPA: hypothetical protein U1398_001315, partial [Streptococcus suis]|nr:hypothetical protein [Streptococcus suis]